MQKDYFGQEIEEISINKQGNYIEEIDVNNHREKENQDVSDVEDNSKAGDDGKTKYGWHFIKKILNESHETIINVSNNFYVNGEINVFR